MMMQGDMLFSIPGDYAETQDSKSSNPDIYAKLKNDVAKYGTIKAKAEILIKGPKNGFVAPKTGKLQRRIKAEVSQICVKQPFSVFRLTPKDGRHFTVFTFCRKSGSECTKHKKDINHKQAEYHSHTY